MGINIDLSILLFTCRNQIINREACDDREIFRREPSFRRLIKEDVSVGREKVE